MDAAAPFQLGLPPVMVPNGNYHFLNVPGAVTGQGQPLGVASAGLIPYIPTANKVQLLLQIEDMKNGGAWEPALAMFGGKVSNGETHWTRTALREMEEELGAAAQHVQPLLHDIAAINPPQLPAQRGATCTFVPASKYQAMFLPVSTADMQGMQQLPGSYYQAYQGMTSDDLQPGDWSRAARKLVWVEVQRAGPGLGWRVTNTDLSHLAAGAPAGYADLFPQPWALPVKPELSGALQRWRGP